jgi:integrase
MVMEACKPIDEVVAAVTAALRAAGYVEGRLVVYRTCLRRLKRLCDEHGGMYTKRLGALFASQTTSPRSGEFSKQRYFDHGRCARLADSYLESGVVDLSMWRKPRLAPRTSGFVALVAAWEADGADRGLADSTRWQYSDAARRFLVHAEAEGFTSLEAAPGWLATGFLESLAGSWAPTGLRSFMSAFRPFVRFTGQERLIAALECVRFDRARLVAPVLGDAEVAAVVAAAGSAAVSARDRAITLLALATGLRACDICALRLEDIDWRAGRISIVQQKTGNPLTLPLLPQVGNAISAYLLGKRPADADGHVFVRACAPHTGLSAHAAIHRVLKRVFGLAGVAPPVHGTFLTRHSAASRMLRAGTPAPVISAVLGHADPASADRYLAADADAMRRCVLPLPEAVSR